MSNSPKNQSVACISPEYAIDIQREYPHPIDQVWEAVTTAEGISAWMQYEATLERRIGGRILVNFKSEGNLEGVVCQWEPNRIFAYTWGLSVVRWQLDPIDGGTRLHFTNSHAMPDIVVEFAAGWHAFIDHLGPYLDDATIKDRYEDLIVIYKDQFPNLIQLSRPE